MPRAMTLLHKLLITIVLSASRLPSPDLIGEDSRTCMPRTVSSCLKDQTLKMKLVWDKVQLGLLGATMQIFLTGGGTPFFFFFKSTNSK